MSQENVDVVRAIIAAAETGDWDTAIKAFDPEVQLDQTRLPGGGVYKGFTGVWSFYEKWFGSWEEFRIDSQGVIAVPDGRVLSLDRVSGRGRRSGVEVAMETANVYTLRNGKIIQMTGYPARSEALEALGLSEQDAHADSS